MKTYGNTSAMVIWFKAIERLEAGVSWFALDPSDIEGICPPHIWGGQVQGDMRGDIGIMEGPNFDRLYHKLKVLLLLLLLLLRY